MGSCYLEGLSDYREDGLNDVGDLRREGRGNDSSDLLWLIVDHARST
jgi:hypothetical protein